MSRILRPAILALLVSTLALSCTAQSKLNEQTAPNVTTPRSATVAPVNIEIAGQPSAVSVTTTPADPTLDFAAALPEIPPTVAPTSEPVAAPTTAATTPPATPASTATLRPTAAPTIPATTPPTTPPAAPAAPAASTATLRPTAAPTIPATTPATSPATSEATTPAPVTAPPTTDVPAIARPTTTTAAQKPQGPFAVAGAPCLRSQRDLVRSTRKGVPLRCTITGRRGRWVTDLTTGSPPAALTPGVVPGFDGTTIRIGLLTTTTNPTWGAIGRAINAGIEARIAAINRRGGIGGRYKVIVVKAETNYDPIETLTQIQATKNNVVAYVSLLGTPSTEASEPVLRAEGLLASPASQEARWATAPNLLPIFNSYQVQAINGMAFFAEQFQTANPGVRPIVCGVSIATSFGEAGSEGLRAAAQSLPVTLGPIVSIAANESAYGAVVGTLKGAGCQATFLTVGPAQTLGLVLTGRQLTFVNRWIIMGAAFSDRIVTAQTGPLFEQGAWVVGDGTQWGDETVPGMMQLKADLLASDNRFWTENPDIGLSYGWAQARTIEQVLETAVARNDLSRSGVLTASQAMGTVDLGGIGSPTNYSQSVRLANARTTIFNVDNSYRNAIRVLARDYSSPAAQAYRR